MEETSVASNTDVIGDTDAIGENVGVDAGDDTEGNFDGNVEDIMGGIIDLISQSTAPLMAISPLDGRYATKVTEISKIFSEYALIKWRRHVEIYYWLELTRAILGDTAQDLSQVEKICHKLMNDFTTVDALQIKAIERETNHDVKAVEQHVRKLLLSVGISEMSVELTHFGLTSHDINSIAMNLQMVQGINYISEIVSNFCSSLDVRASWWDHDNICMLAHTHGQPATPCMLGGQMLVFVKRLRDQIKLLDKQHDLITVKFGGATGNLNAHNLAFPDIDWSEFADSFVEGCFGFTRVWPTTQVEYFDKWSEIFDCIRRINGILIDLARDMWMYISYGYFKQQNKAGEVGSSTMPHKINPIQFENAEGNALLANVLFQFFSQQFQLSRMQRDLVNSTLWRNVGVAFGHTTLAVKSLIDAFERIEPNAEMLERDLENHYEVLSEAMQIMLRKYCNVNAYNKVKEMFRGSNGLSKEEWCAIVTKLSEQENVHQDVITTLLDLTPSRYAKTLGNNAYCKSLDGIQDVQNCLARPYL